MRRATARGLRRAAPRSLVIAVLALTALGLTGPAALADDPTTDSESTVDFNNLSPDDQQSIRDTIQNDTGVVDCGDSCGSDTGDATPAPFPAPANPNVTPGPVPGCFAYKGAFVQTLGGGISGLTPYQKVAVFYVTVDCSRAKGIYAVAGQVGGKYCSSTGFTPTTCGTVAPNWTSWVNGSGPTTFQQIRACSGALDYCSVSEDFGAASGYDGSQLRTWLITQSN